MIFPLRNHRGQVVGFSGRTLDPEAKTAKYINTPETTLYHKKKLLYGYAEQLSKLREADEVIVTEGEFDVLSSVQAKVQNVVAVKGSALTEQHARRLKRVVSTVILALDADDAGMEATRKAAQVCQQEDLELRVVNLARVPVITEDNWGELREDVLQWHEQGQSGVKAFEAIGKDPDDLARTEPKRWRDMVKQTISVYDFFLGYAVLKHDPTDPGGKRSIVDIMAPVLMTLSHAVERDFYIKKLALVLQVRESAVREDLRGSMERQRTGRRRRPQQDAEEQENQPDILSFEPTTRRERLEQYFLFLITQLDRLTPTQRNQFLNYQAATPALQPLYTQVQDALEDEPETLDLDAVASGLEEPQAELLFEIAASPNLFSIIEEADLSEEWKDTRNELQTWLSEQT